MNHFLLKHVLYTCTCLCPAEILGVIIIVNMI